MKNFKQIRKWSTFLVVLFAMWSCEIVEDNNPPTADAGTNFELEVGETATLDGGNSSDSDGDELTYTWEFTSVPGGSSVNISNADSPIASFIPDAAGEYIITLTVEDPMGAQGTDDVQILAIANEPPVAVITDASGQPINNENGNNEINVNNVMQLHGTESTDPEGDELSYSWNLVSGPSEGTVTLVNSSSSVLSLSADFAGDYSIALTVDDGKGNTNTAEVLIKVLENPNEPPVAVITDDSGQSFSGENQNNEIVLGNSLQLFGAESTDPEGDELTYSWAVTSSPEGSNPTLTNENTGALTFTPDITGDYTIALTVDDGQGNTNTAEAVITVIANQPPEAIITDVNGQAIAPENNNSIIHVENTFQLSGANSTDPEGDELTYLWEVVSAPTNSTPTLVNTTTATLDFIADLIGDYTISLTVDDGNGNQGSATVTIEAEASPVEINSNVDANTTWENIYSDPRLPDYIITGNIDINAELTIEPGVFIQVVQDAFIEVQASGVLKAIGTQADSIKFTSSNIPGNIKWGGLLIVSGNIQNELNYVEVSHAGNSRLFYTNQASQFGNIGIADNGKLNIKNSLISNSAGQGAYVISNGLVEFENNNFVNNNGYALTIPFNQIGKIDGNTNVADNGSFNYVRVFRSSMTDNQSIVALKNDQSYRISGDISLESELNIGAGVKMEFDQNTFFTVETTGLLKAIGTTNNKIVMTSSNIPGGLYWGGLLVESGNALNELDHVEVSYGGESRMYYVAQASRFANIGLTSTGKISIKNSLIANGKDEGIFAQENSLNVFSNNELKDNSGYAMSINFDEIGKIDENTTFLGNGDDGVRIYIGDMSTDQTINNLSGDAYYTFTADVDVNSNLQINEGAELRFNQERIFTVTANGSIKSIGVAGNTVKFTSTNIAGNIKWAGILIKSQSTLNEFRHTEISYGGANGRRLEYISSGNRHANIVVSQGRLDIYDCTLSNSDNEGLIVRSGDIINGIDNSDVNAESTVEGQNSFANNGAQNVLFLN